MVDKPSLLTNITSIKPITIKVGGSQRLVSTQSGTLTLGPAIFQKVLHVPNLGCNLISIAATPKSLKWEIQPNLFDLYNNQQKLLSAGLYNGLYRVKASQAFAHLATSADDLLREWHHRLGHTGVSTLMRMAKDGRIDLDGVSNSDATNFQCKSCI